MIDKGKLLYIAICLIGFILYFVFKDKETKEIVMKVTGSLIVLTFLIRLQEKRNESR